MVRKPHTNEEIKEMLDKEPNKNIFLIYIPLYPLDSGECIASIRSRIELELRMGLTTL